MAITDFEYVKLCNALGKGKNVIVTGIPSSGKTSLVNKYLSENKNKYSKIYVCCFDREKYLLYGKSHNLTVDCILKTALLSSFSLHDGKYLSDDCYSDFEKRLCENTLLVIENYDIASPSPYMRHLAKLPCRIIAVSRCEMKNCGKDFETVALEDNNFIPDINERTENLSERQSELLRTLAAMLCYLRDDTLIKSSKTGVFDIYSLKFYLGSLSDELYGLFEAGLVNIHENGRISISRAISEYVLKTLSPTAQNCPTFMYFCEKYCDFLINTSVKDNFGVINANKSDSDIFATRELVEVYTYFSLTDENAPLRIYNLLISYLLTSVGKAEVNNTTEHLFLRNKDYMLCLLENELSKAGTFDFLMSDESSMESDLDLVRLCVCSLRNMPFSLYKANRTIIGIFARTIEKLHRKISCLEEETTVKAELYGDVIRICYETFSYGGAITQDAKYICFRNDYINHRIKYVSRSQCDRMNAVSLYMGYSADTVRLYGLYQKFLDSYIEASGKTDVSRASFVLQKLHNERLTDFIEISKNLSVHYCRIKNGYDNFYDFLDEKYEKIKIYKTEFDDGFEKRLKDNRHYLVRGFDKATKTGAKKYAEEIINTLETVSNPFPYLRILFDSTYPLNDEVYRCLSISRLSKLVSETEKMPNMTKQILLEYLVDIVFVGCPKKEYTKLIFDCIDKLLGTVNQTVASAGRLSNIASAMYLENIFYCLENNKPYHDIEALYCRCANHSDVADGTSDEYFAKVLYSKLCGKMVNFNKGKLLSAMKCIVYEYMTEKNDFSRKGFVEACRVVSDEKTAKSMLDMLVSYDFSNTLTKELCDEMYALHDK